jgi:hypothetical protein
LKQGEKTFLGSSKPWIFYNSDWQKKTEYLYDSSGQVVDVDGDVIMDPDDSNNRPPANMRTWTIPNGFETGDMDRNKMLLDMKVCHIL